MATREPRGVPATAWSLEGKAACRAPGHWAKGPRTGHCILVLRDVPSGPHCTGNTHPPASANKTPSMSVLGPEPKLQPGIQLKLVEKQVTRHPGRGMGESGVCRTCQAVLCRGHLLSVLESGGHTQRPGDPEIKEGGARTWRASERSGKHLSN